jgi:hypothetical protein
MTRYILLAVIGFACISCDKIGGGVAGAGFDSVWVRNAAKNYHGYKDASVSLTREAASVPDVQQTFEKMLDSFPEHTLVDQDTNSTLGELQISFQKQHISVQQAGRLLFEEQLPAAFYMHELRLGVSRCAVTTACCLSRRAERPLGYILLDFTAALANVYSPRQCQPESFGIVKRHLMSCYLCVRRSVYISLFSSLVSDHEVA